MAEVIKCKTAEEQETLRDAFTRSSVTLQSPFENTVDLAMVSRDELRQEYTLHHNRRLAKTVEATFPDTIVRFVPKSAVPAGMR